MSWMSDLVLRLRGLLRRRRVEQELDDEVRFHLERQIEANLATGMSPKDARNRALQLFGGTDQMKEECRDARGTRFLEDVVQDVRFGLRMLRKAPGFTSIAVVTLALGIGANAAIFSVVNAALLRRLPYPASERIVHLSLRTRGGDESDFPSPEFLAIRAHSRSFSSVSAYAYNSVFNLWTGAEPVFVKGLYVSSDLFDVLQVRPALGRGFAPEEDRAGAPPTVLLSYDLWQRHFHSDTALIGRSIQMNGQDFTVVGVLPRDFRFTPSADVWLPLLRTNANDPGDNFSVLARLAPGVPLPQARAEVQSFFDEFRRTWGKEEREFFSGIGVASYREWLGQDLRTSLFLLLGAVGVVLLIASANVVNLLLERATARESELAVRAALGASSGRLLRQSLTECVLLAVLGGAAGLLAAPWALRIILAVTPSSGAMAPLAGRVEIDSPVFLFALTVSLLAALLVGVVPALQVRRLDLSHSLREGGRTAQLSGGRRARSVLVVTEIALSVILLAGAALLLRTLLELQSVPFGFKPGNLWTMQMSIPPEKFKTTAQVWEFERQVLERIRALPGVQSAATTSNLPIERGQRFPARAEDQPFAILEMRAISPDYFRAMGIPLRQGREFADADSAASKHVAIVNQAFAARFWPGKDPLGQRVYIGRSGWAGPPLEVVGVAADSKLNGLTEAPLAAVFVPQSQLLSGITAYTNHVFLTAWVIRSAAPLDLAALQEAVWQIDPAQPLVNLRPMEEVIATSIAPQRFYALLMGAFAALALLLAAVGIYGVMSYGITQRTREIGIRMALGAQPRDVLRLVAGEGLRLALVGAAIGLGVAMAATRLLQEMLFGVKPTDPVSFACATVLLVGVALVASLVPARRATRMDPMTALREE